MTDKDAHLTRLGWIQGADARIPTVKGRLSLIADLIGKAREYAQRMDDESEALITAVQAGDETAAAAALAKFDLAAKEVRTALAGVRKEGGGTSDALSSIAGAYPSALNIDLLFPAKEEGTLFG